MSSATELRGKEGYHVEYLIHLVGDKVCPRVPFYSIDLSRTIRFVTFPDPRSGQSRPCIFWLKHRGDSECCSLPVDYQRV
jgi:hypothetical protein